jgi:hypothetical protein
MMWISLGEGIKTKSNHGWQPAASLQEKEKEAQGLATRHRGTGDI